MPNLIGLGAGAGATALTLVLGLAFWSPMEKAPAPGKPLVSQPVFVASSAPARPRAATPPATTPAVDKDDAALAKLAIALKSDTSAAPASSKGATRSLTIAATSPAAPGSASDMARRLCAQGLVALAAGDITGARLYFEASRATPARRAIITPGLWRPAWAPRASGWRRSTPLRGSRLDGCNRAGCEPSRYDFVSGLLGVGCTGIPGPIFCKLPTMT
jgi:hypothetical protein